LRLFSFGGYGLALAALAHMVFGAIECPLCQRFLYARDFAELFLTVVISITDRDTILGMTIRAS